MESGPLVVAVMITGKNPKRIPLARASIAAFQEQVYANRQLLIINTGLDRLTDAEPAPAQIHEMHNPQQGMLSLGALRNVALDWIAAQRPPDTLVIQWDDDDWHHPQRIAFQVAHAELYAYQRPVTLRYQIRCDLRTGVAFVHTGDEPQWGIHGTILHPQVDFRYPEIGRHEDSHFLKRFPEASVLETMSQLYIRMSHGNNTFSNRHIMHHFANRLREWHLPADAAAYLAAVLTQHYPRAQTPGKI
jgi:hypothetical protein